jgi:ribulose-phosphate 3-epimerase
MGAIKVAPSVLSADFGRLGEQIAEAAEGGADWIHLDVMDGHFVPNLTFGAPVIAAVRRFTNVPFDVHVMVANPDSLVPALAGAGADYITVHAEAVTDLAKTIAHIKSKGVKPGVAISPDTPVSALDDVLADLDLVVVMSVHPGFGGQSFIPGALQRTRQIRESLDAIGSSAELEVDGGISAANSGEVAAAGASVLVAGSAVYGAPDGVAAAIAGIKATAAL